tara:strand:+ start:160474 stop:161130 length:657 start_codon:yes stop_codon:yes gene_type:complete
MTEEIDDKWSDKELEFRSMLLSLIKSYENRILALQNKAADEYHAQIVPGDDEDDSHFYGVDELFELDAKSLRVTFLDQLDHVMEEGSKVRKGTPSSVYREILFSLVDDRFQRTVGYYQAMRKTEEQARKYNSSVASEVFAVEAKSMQSTLHKLDDIYFLRNLATSLGLLPSDVDHIVSNHINRLFSHKVADSHHGRSSDAIGRTKLTESATPEQGDLS